MDEIEKSGILPSCYYTSQRSWHIQPRSLSWDCGPVDQFDIMEIRDGAEYIGARGKRPMCANVHLSCAED